MMIRTRLQSRRGAVTIEMGLVSILFFMMLFGIFEYGRLLYVMHVANNAARDAVRYAAVHTGGPTMSSDPATINASNLINLVTTGQIGGEVIGSGMAGMDKNIQNYTVQVFAVDPNGLSQTPPVVQAMANSQWSDAAFSQPIAVTISGSYNPVLPSLLFMNSSIPFQVTVMCSSEAN